MKLGWAYLYRFVDRYWIDSGDDGWDVEHRFDHCSWIYDGNDDGVTILVNIITFLLLLSFCPINCTLTLFLGMIEYKLE